MGIAFLQDQGGSGAALPWASRRGPELRDFIQRLEAAGYLVRVREPVEWKYEIGRRTRESRRPMLFESVEGYPGQGVFANGLCDGSAIALALGIEGETSRAALIAEIHRRITAPVAPVWGDSRSVLRNLVRGDALDLLQLPVPHWNELDAGRYIGTWHINVTKDPETAARNVGVYRMQVLSSRTATVSASAGSDLTRHVMKAEAAGEALPMAVAIGVPEAVVMAAGAAYQGDEFALAGALQGAPVDLMRCETVNLEVPARAEIVIEGFIQPGVRVQDGPYFDYCGRTNTNPRAFLFEVAQMMYRTDAIFRGAAIGAAGAEDHQLFSVLAELGLVNFHGSQVKQRIENALMRRRFFGTMQGVGKVGSVIKRLAGRQP